MRIKRLSLIRSAVACWFSRLASDGPVSRSRAAAAAAAMRRRVVEAWCWMASGWMRRRPARPALSLACVIGRRRVSASTHAAPFSPASFHSRHIRRSRPNSIIFGDGRRPRGAIGDYAGGMAGRAVPRRSPALFCRSTDRVPSGRAPSRSSRRKSSIVGR